MPLLADARPSLPDELSDRAQDVWELLIAITDFIGDAWPERARPAAVALSGRTTKDDEDVSIRLLADIRDCFALHPRVARVQTAELLEYLNSLDTSPWAGWHGGRGLSGQALAARLRGSRIRPHDPARYGDRAGVKGYDRAAFEDAWARLLPPGGVYDIDDFSRHKRSGFGS